MQEELGHLYPSENNEDVPFAYLWAKVATCSNPTCAAEIPLLKQ